MSQRLCVEGLHPSQIVTPPGRFRAAINQGERQPSSYAIPGFQPDAAAAALSPGDSRGKVASASAR
jgi:hypothetical protein